MGLAHGLWQNGSSSGGLWVLFHGRALRLGVRGGHVACNDIEQEHAVRGSGKLSGYSVFFIHTTECSRTAYRGSGRPPGDSTNQRIRQGVEGPWDSA